jgi:thiamine biosynthesis lipoprotein
MNPANIDTTASVRRARPLLGTLVDITAFASDAATAERAVNAAYVAIEKVQTLMSYHDPFSEISRLNCEAHLRPVQVSEWTYEVLTLAQKLARESGGAFDITVAPHLASWGYLPRTPANSRRERFATWRDISLEPEKAVAFHRPLHIDLGGIAKGFAVDRAVAALRETGATAGCVNAGGDLRVFGSATWPVHVRNPAQPIEMAQALGLENAAMATSASYFSRKRWRRCWVCPLIDGRTRRPCDDEVSASVIAAEAVLADALTKVVLARRESAADLLKTYDARAFLIDREGQCKYVAAGDAS